MSFHRALCLTSVLAVAMLSGGNAAAKELTSGLTLMYNNSSLSPPTNVQMTVCYGFNCRRRYRLDFTPADRKNLTEILAAGRASAEAERKAVQKAVVWFDKRVGPIVGTKNRIANADIRSLNSGQNFDCFDTTRNTSSLLLVLDGWGLLKHHLVADPRYRGNVLIGQLPHNTAVLKDRKTGVDWVVDMWPRGYGEAPDVMTVEKWLTEL